MGMKILMLRTCRGSNNGWGTEVYERDTIYEVTEELACIFVRKNQAEHFITKGKNHMLTLQ